MSHSACVRAKTSFKNLPSNHDSWVHARIERVCKIRFEGLCDQPCYSYIHTPLEVVSSTTVIIQVAHCIPNMWVMVTVISAQPDINKSVYNFPNFATNFSQNSKAKLDTSLHFYPHSIELIFYKNNPDLVRDSRFWL